jgi:heterodisulfide reductase subunit B
MLNHKDCNHGKDNVFRPCPLFRADDDRYTPGIQKGSEPKPKVTTINVQQAGVTQDLPPKPIKLHEHVITYRSPE